MIKYKLTDQNFRTYGGCQWGENITHETSGKGPLCGRGWIHVYDSPELAVFLNPIHADFRNPVLWKARVGGKSLHDHGLKSGYTKVTTLKRLPLPSITTEQRVAFAIRCALAVYKNKNFEAWAKAWLSGENRLFGAAIDAAAGAAHDRVYAAAHAAYAAAHAISGCPLCAAHTAGYAATNAAIDAKRINLKKIAKEALQC